MQFSHIRSGGICKKSGDEIAKSGHSALKVFYRFNHIYEAKVLKVQNKPANGDKWPRFYVHYLGWNAR